MTAPAPESAEPIVRLLAERIGLDPASVGENLIRAGIRSRMALLGLARLTDYERALQKSGDEVQALVEEVVVPESWFFRDDRPFAAFRAIARAGWIDQPARGPLSILCLPCAGGEEPYSVVMTLLDLGLPRERFQVIAVDVSERALARAARGVYGASSFRGVSTTARDRYFDPAETPGRFLIRPAIRSAVRFERGNILDSHLLSGRPGFDVVFCRNLLIYFDDEARARAARSLARLAVPDGYLFLGHADRPEATLLAQFAAEGDPGSFVYRRRDAVATPSPPPPALQPALSRSSERVRPTTAVAASGRTSAPGRSAPRSSAAPPCPPLSAPPVPTRPGPASQTNGDEALGLAASLADLGRYREAAELVRSHLGRGPLDAPAHALLGMILQAAGDRAAAEAELLKAVYLDPDHDEALLALSVLARRRGDVAAEALMRRRAERARARKERV